ncbi:MAG: sugar ABC transporter substrate-binding protein, partial [Glutamicibacter sp.]
MKSFTAMKFAAIAAAGALALTACGGSGEQGTAEGGDEAVKIGISQFVSHPSLDAVVTGFKA